MATGAEDYAGFYIEQIRSEVKLRLQCSKDQKNSTKEDWKNVALSDESGFLLWNSADCARIWHQQKESGDTPWFVSNIQAGAGSFILY